jgi:hypothetical protein
MLLNILRITVIKGCIPQLKSEPLRNRKIEPFFWTGYRLRYTKREFLNIINKSDAFTK